MRRERACQAKDPKTCRKHGVQQVMLAEFMNQYHEKTQPKVVRFDEVFHVGSLNSGDKRTDSYEGQGLSVSVHPDSWSKITPLGGSTWVLQRQLKFLDLHALTEQQKETVLDYGQKNDWIESSVVHEVSWFDDEWGTEMTMQFTDHEEALEEAENYETDVVTRESFLATESFPDSTVKAGQVDVFDKLVTVWVDRTQPGLDGVWWDDILDESRLSAPRGVLSVSKITELVKHFKSLD